ncbi:MAG TPA: ABC transporter permease [Bryobacteraceae bacterium]|nr:ABC transporter permease [Bryobacteraceae bacterium]
MGNWRGSVRYALRQFRRSPVFTAAATLTLALGIGGTTAIFTLIHAIMLRSLPVADPALLYRIGDGDNCCVMGGPQDRWGFYSYALFERLKAATPEFDELAAFQAGGWRSSVRREGSPALAKSLRTEYVTGNYFSTLGVAPFGGRLFTAADDRPSAAPVIVLSHHIWQLEYGADPAVVGSTLLIAGHPFQVIGVTPPGFFGETLRGDPPDIWIPLQQEPVIAGDRSLLRQSAAAWLRVIGRLHAGASIAGIGPRLTGVLRQWMQNEAGYPSNWMPEVIRSLPKQVINVVPAGAGVATMKEEYGRSLRILLAVCAMVLLIACANVANLLLARGMSRRAQTALRLAVGAGAREVIGQALVEATLLALAGGIAGLGVAVAAGRLLLSLAFRGSHFVPISTLPSPMVLAFAFAVALLTGIIFGAAPAWFAARTSPLEALRGVGRSTADHSSVARKALLIVQAAISVVLIAGATMLARSLDRLEHQNLGYRTDGRVIVSLNVPATGYGQPQLAALYRRLEDGLRRIPGVTAAGLALYNPLTDNWGEMIMVAGHPPAGFNGNSGASWDRVSPEYLQELGVGLVRGRYFTRADDENTEPVAIINETFAKRFFRSGEDPLGQHFGIDVPENAGMYRIVGIVRDAKFAGFALRDPARPMFYVPLAQWAPYKDHDFQTLELRSHVIGGMLLVSSLPPGTLEPALSRILSEADPNLAIVSIRTLGQQLDRMFDQERAVASLAGLFGAVALLLAAVGLYGVTAYTVAQRTNEIGIRMALGADRLQVVRQVLRGALTHVAAGLALGLPLAVGAARLIASQLYDVPFWDPIGLGVAAGALAICALAAAMIPATVAASISPNIALREHILIEG